MEQADYEALAGFRLEIRRFMDFSRHYLEGEGLPPVQYQAMLAIKARSGAPFSIGDLATELFIRVQSAVELVGRMRDADLVLRRSAPEDRRRILLSLTDRGEALLPRLADRHLREMHAKAPAFAAALERFDPACGEPRIAPWSAIAA